MTLKKQSTFISYLDMNNLYGWAISEYLPYERFKWLKNVERFDVTSVNEKSPIGYFFEVDLEYSDKLHELHNDYPIVPEKLAVSSAVYVVHYRNLQLYLSLEMRLTKIHGVLVLK